MSDMDLSDEQSSLQKPKMEAMTVGAQVTPTLYMAHPPPVCPDTQDTKDCTDALTGKLAGVRCSRTTSFEV